MTATKEQYLDHAESYLDFWNSMDFKAHDIFTNPKKESVKKRGERVEEVLCQYGIECNFSEKREIAKKKSRFEPVFDAVDSVSESDLNRDGAVKTVDYVRTEFKDFYGKNNLVAASKTLWFKFRSPIVICDSRTINSLGLKRAGLQYEDFFRRWQEEFGREKSKISEACAELAEKSPDDDDKKVILEPWFEERVFDFHLCGW